MQDAEDIKARVAKEDETVTIEEMKVLMDHYESTLGRIRYVLESVSYPT